LSFAFLESAYYTLSEKGRQLVNQVQANDKANIRAKLKAALKS
jgi:hypothetical protein